MLSLLITALALPLTSCSETARLNRMDEAERAVAFYELFEEKSDQASSVTVEQKISLKLDIGEVAYEQINESTSIYVEEGDELTYLEQSVTTVWAGGEKTVTYQDEGSSLPLPVRNTRPSVTARSRTFPISWWERATVRP